MFLKGDTMNKFMKLLKPLNDFMNDNDRGPGHGIAQGLFYGVLFLPFTTNIVLLISVLAANHLRVLYQELFIEGWSKKKKDGDFYYDAIFRPLQTDITVLFGIVSSSYWFLIILGIIVTGFKKKSNWPLLMFWR